MLGVGDQQPQKKSYSHIRDDKLYLVNTPTSSTMAGS